MPAFLPPDKPVPDEPAPTAGLTRRASVAAMVGAVVALPGAARAAQGGEEAPGERLQRSPAAEITSVHGKLRHIVMADEDYGFAPGRPAAANARALQRAVDDAQVITLPNSAEFIEFAGTVTIPPYTQLIGAGADRTRLNATGPLGLLHATRPPGDDIEGPRFAEFMLQCAGSGIRLNDAGGGFNGAAADVQKSIMRARFDRIKLSGPGPNVGASTGIELNKCFSAVLDQCWIAGFGTGVKTRGSDFTGILGRTRIWQCGTLVQCEKDGNFGSGTLIDGADLLLPSRSFIRSSDQHLIVRNTYFEKQMAGLAPLTGPVLDIELSYMALFTGNRFETPAAHCPRFLSVNGEGTLFVFEHNSYGGEGWGTTDWNRDNSALYMYNPTVRQKIVVRGNKQAIPIPFNTVDDEGIRNERRDLWVLGPGTGGFLSPFNYAEHCRVQDGAFVLPPGRGSVLRFRDRDRPASGRLSIYVLARSDGGRARLDVNALNGEIGGVGSPLDLGPAFAWYAAFEGVERTDLAIDLLNEGGGRALIKQIVVERAGAGSSQEL